MSDKNNIRKLILKNTRYLQKLREQEAEFGVHTPVQILTEIEDRETRIKDLQAELGGLGGVEEEEGVKVTQQAISGAHSSKLSSLSRVHILLFAVIFVLVIAAIGGAIISYNKLVSKPSSFTSGFAPIWMDAYRVNADNINYVVEGPELPETIDWYILESKEVISSVTTTKIDYSNIGHYLYYYSNLKDEVGSWTAIFLWRRFPLPTIQVSEKSELIVIIYAKESDTLEIKFKDAHGNEEMIPLNVKKDWAGYRIPINEFSSIDYNKIEILLIGHSRGVGSRDDNVFKIALLSLK